MGGLILQLVFIAIVVAVSSMGKKETPKPKSSANPGDIDIGEFLSDLFSAKPKNSAVKPNSMVNIVNRQAKTERYTSRSSSSSTRQNINIASPIQPVGARRPATKTARSSAASDGKSRDAAAARAALAAAKARENAAHAGNAGNKPGLFNGQNDLVKAFIMSEVLNRYDLNRIYSRIPEFRDDD